jgi:hypothetical protein
MAKNGCNAQERGRLESFHTHTRRRHSETETHTPSCPWPAGFLLHFMGRNTQGGGPRWSATLKPAADERWRRYLEQESWIDGMGSRLARRVASSEVCNSFRQERDSGKRQEGVALESKKKKRVEKKPNAPLTHPFCSNHVTSCMIPPAGLPYKAPRRRGSSSGCR